VDSALYTTVHKLHFNKVFGGFSGRMNDGGGTSNDEGTSLEFASDGDTSHWEGVMGVWM
jgi:hypothetical protein